jgi:hypothetical protein
MPTNDKKRIVRRAKRKTGGGRRLLVVLSAVVLCVAAVIAYKLLVYSSLETSTPRDSARESDAKGDFTQPQIIGEGYQLSIAKINFTLEVVDNKDVLRVIVEKLAGKEKEDENVRFRYEWSINSKPAGADADNVTGFKRGDTVAVKVTPFEGDKRGAPRVLSLVIQNLSPKVSELKELKNDGKNLSYQVIATDPDGDTLSYSLLESPPGMTIDSTTGVVNWQLKEGDAGKYMVKVKVSDGKGGQVTYPVEMKIGKNGQ